MSDHDYLFDREGPAEADVLALEEALSPLRHGAPRRVRPAALGAVGALLLLLTVTALWMTRGPEAWSVQTASCAGCTWVEGAWLDTTRAASARLADRGEAWVSAGGELRLVDRDERAHLELHRGRLEVRVDAPPRWLTVSVPGVDVVDLGCAYVVDVRDDGTGVVAVQSGAVALEGTGAHSVLPAGTMAATWPDGHTGLPVVVGADPAFVAVVDAADRGGPLQPVLSQAGRDDAITVWHLLERASDRGVVVDKLQRLLGELPVEEARLRAGDAEARDELLAYIIGRTL